MNINNRRVEKENVTFYQWLNIFEMVTKNEFRTFQPEVQENLKKEYESWKTGHNHDSDKSERDY